jgi:hypothetical protein
MDSVGYLGMAILAAAPFVYTWSFFELDHYKRACHLEQECNENGKRFDKKRRPTGPSKLLPSKRETYADYLAIRKDW